MSEILPTSVKRLIHALSRLPGVGQRTATRYALSLVRDGAGRMDELLGAIDDVRREVVLCSSCYGLASGDDLCSICRDAGRDPAVVCVLESVADQMAVEASCQFQGRYFVCHRLISPLKGIGPEENHLDLLLARAARGELGEVIVATPMSTDGETTATFLKRAMVEWGVPVTRLASGVPVGGTIEYLDQLTLARALQNRQEL